MSVTSKILLESVSDKWWFGSIGHWHLFRTGHWRLDQMRGTGCQVFGRGLFSCWLLLLDSASKRSIQRFVIMEKAPTRAFSWLKAATTAFTLKTLLRHYAKRALTPRSLNVKLGPWRNYHKGRAAIRHYANQPAHLLWHLHWWPNFMSTYDWVNASLAYLTYLMMEFDFFFFTVLLWSSGKGKGKGST